MEIEWLKMGALQIHKFKEWILIKPSSKLTHQQDDVASAMKLTVSKGLPGTGVPQTETSNNGAVDCPFTEAASCATTNNVASM